MNEIFKKDNDGLQKIMENETVCWAEVSRLMRNEDEHYLILTMPRMLDHQIGGGERCVIFEGESDADAKTAEQQRSRLMYLMGHRVPFVVTGIDEENERLICSRKRAQEILKTTMAQKLVDGHVFEGQLTGFAKFGAFVEINGVTGFIRNGDFSDDHSSIKEFLSVGDKLEVRCREMTPEGAIFLEVVKKFHRNKPVEHDFEPNSVVMGRVSRISNFSQGVGVFVNLQLGIDALCPMPRDIQIEEDARVLVKIDTVTPGKKPTDSPRIRGRILRVQ